MGHSLNELEYIAFHSGSKDVLANVEAIHAENPSADLHTGSIVKKVSKQTGASIILSRISREIMDLNRPRGGINYPAVDQYRNTIAGILDDRNLLNESLKLNLPFLHISLHGMQDEWNRDLEIGTGYGHYCSKEVKAWFVNQVDKVTNNYGVDDIFPGYTFRSVLRDGDLYSSTDFTGFGANYHAIQLEVSRYWREHYPLFLTRFLTDVVLSFHGQFVHNPAIMVDYPYLMK